ncbi:MAG: universal stress protein [Verrucomicrobia bacterium]|nr:universal stress protein [Verrucomicrobiota bacterium]
MNIRNELIEQCEPNGTKPVFCKNILAPIDLSKEAKVDVDTAICLAEHYDADLWLLGFSSEPAISTDSRGLCNYVWSSWSRRAQVRLWDWVLEARERHYRTFPLFVGGRYDAHEIIRTAERLMADMIVVPIEESDRRSTGLEEAQTNELLRKSATPVFVAIAPRHASRMK